MSDDWQDLEPFSFQMDGHREIKFIGRTVGEDGQNRLAPRKRPWQKGEKVDSTGPDGDSYQIEGIFHSDVDEGDVDNGMPMWPDALEALVKQFKEEKTGTLHLPWKRGLRVKASNWSRRASADEHRGGEVLTVTFKEDNEDSLDREAFVGVSVKGSLSRTVEEAQFDAESAGIWDGSLEDLTGLASDLVGYINAPREFAGDVKQASNRVRRAVSSVTRAFSGPPPIQESPAAPASPGDEGRNQLNDPDGFNLRIRLLELLDLAAAAEAEARRSLPRTRSYIPERDTSIWLIATDPTVRQDPHELMRINDIEDPNYIEAGTVMRVFAE